jgi:hypothetical protein
VRFQSKADAWTRKLHYYLGLYFLLFLWLFSLSGLVLNHSEWTFAQFWPQRRQSHYERPVRQDTTQTDMAQAPVIMEQVGIRGEVEWLTQTQAPGHLAFRATRPGYTYEVDVDWSRRIASVHETTVNAWGILSALHHFNGVRAGDPRNARDWLFTTVWTFCMDALAAGLIFTVFSGVYIWYRSGRRRFAGLAALLTGIIASCVVVFGRG